LGQQGCGVGRGLLQAGLSVAETAVVAAGIDALWRGRSLSPREIWPQDPVVAEEVFASLAAAGRAEVDDAGRVFGVHGFTLSHTRHTIFHGDVKVHTWCAFDSIGIPAAFGLDATAATDCPTCGRGLTVAISGGVPEQSVPAGELAQWLPEAAATGDLMGKFCANADIYCSRAHLEQRIDTATAAGSVLTVADAARVGREVWADVAGLAEVP